MTSEEYEGLAMPKINVYLPEDLAEAVREAGVPVSAVCQRALEQAVRRVTAIRETAVADLSARSWPRGSPTSRPGRVTYSGSASSRLERRGNR
jgi:ATP-dependent Clp protease ATP-binding subunit ClpC